MLEQIKTLFSFGTIEEGIRHKLYILSGLMEGYLSNNDNLRLLSITLMILAIFLLLGLIVVLYAKSMTFLFAQDKTREKILVETESVELADKLSEEEKIREEELEKELSRELEKAIVEKAAREEKARAEKQKHNEERAKQKEKQEKEEKKKKLQKKRVPQNDNLVDLDWKKGKLKSMEDLPEPPDIPLKYQQSQKKLSELLGLVLDMIGRNVDDAKIAQTLMFRNMNQSSEETILQTISAIQDFIALCLNGKFASLQTDKELPNEKKALYHLAQGDSSLSLALLESLMDDLIEKGSLLPAGDKRDEVFKTTSNYALVFGTLAATEDVNLATGAFELAIELCPQNINAWNRIGDMYYLAQNEQQAIKAYENVLQLADDDIHPQQKANAEQKLSEYYYEQGDSLQAAQLHNNSKRYYDSIGINRRLEGKEIEIVEFIEANQGEEIEETIHKIFENQSMKQYSFA